MAKKLNEPPKYPEIGARLSQFIEESNEPNARQFAIKAGLTPQLISNLMAGYSIPGGETLVALACTYRKFDANWLLTGSGRLAAPKQASQEQPADAVDYSSGPATVATATELLLREQLIDTVKDLKADKARLIKENVELREENKLLLGKPSDSSDAADAPSEEPRPAPQAPTGQGVLPLPILRVQRVKGLRTYDGDE